ncbi:hypothetical protein [Schlesneria paludicola]|uniref:hypothetical protein n=1 Tax=Schlesneria paludicola TaxID=360056 RepID=UPI00029A0929|nr:hypothetical protein [Schlesneria paludicola]
MWTALLSKELRELSLYAGLALLVQIHFLGAAMDLPLIPYFSEGRGNEIPFLPAYYGSNAESNFCATAVIAAIAFGLHQSIWETWRQTTLFLLHRPMPRRQLLYGKMLAGLLLILAVTALPLLVYSLWAATPGTHASPFFWGMTEGWWRTIGLAVVCYLGAFLTGIRPAYWIGSRSWPLITALVAALGLRFAPIWPSVAYLGFGVLAAGLLVSILETAQSREYP